MNLAYLMPPTAIVDSSTRLRQARKIIEREYATPLTPQRLARRVQLPRIAFLRSFRDAFGLTPQDYLRTCRMRHAARLLGEGRGADDTAQLVGYTRISGFIGDYRRQFRGDPGLLRLLERQISL